MARWKVAKLDELPATPDGETNLRHPVRIHFGISSFGVNAFSADEGTVIEEHDELGTSAGRHEELYLVVSGRATFTIEGEAVDAPAGTFVHVPDPSTKRHAAAEEPGTLVVVVGGQPGVAFSPSPWEMMAPAWEAYRSKDYDAAVAEMRTVVGQFQDNPGTLYNLACMEALAGERDPALDHLERAVELDSSLRELARSDDDFVAVRDDPRFAAVVN